MRRATEILYLQNRCKYGILAHIKVLGGKMKSKKNSDRQAYILLAVTAVIFGIPAKIMGTGNLFNTIMNTAHDLLLNTVFYIMAILLLCINICSVNSVSFNKITSWFNFVPHENIK